MARISLLCAIQCFDIVDGVRVEARAFSLNNSVPKRFYFRMYGRTESKGNRQLQIRWKMAVKWYLYMIID